MQLPADLRTRFFEAPTFDDFLDEVVENRDLWLATYRRAEVPPAVALCAASVGEPRYLLVLLEDWCLDGVSTVPYVARLAEVTPGMEMRVLRRDENPDLMDAHLTGGSRSIPVVMVYDEAFEEIAWWGPRPQPLREWVLEEGLAMPKEERLREIRRWYARDRGATALEEIAALLDAPAGALCGD